jgi:hypothetical protein
MNTVTKNRKSKIALLILFLIFLNLLAMAQDKQWKSKTVNRGKISVRYCISERTDENGKNVPLIEDETSTIENADFKSCIDILKNISKHKEFTGDFISTTVRTLSDHEWIIYYYSKNPWPIANSDCVAKMVFSEDKKEKTAVFTLVAKPGEYEQKGVRRMAYFNVTYTFRNIGEGKVAITITGNSSPPVKVPLWIIKSAFPGEPVKAMRKLVKIIKAQNTITF